MIFLLILWSFLAADTSMEKQECQQMKAALISLQMCVITASLDRAHVPLKKGIFSHNNLSLKSLVLKGTYDKIRSSRVVCTAFQEKPRFLSLSSVQARIIKSKMKTEIPFLFNSLPLYLLRCLKILHFIP